MSIIREKSEDVVETAKKLLKGNLAKTAIRKGGDSSASVQNML